MRQDLRRAIVMTVGRYGRLSRLKFTYPDQAQHPSYDAALARELLTRTCELPASQRGLVLLLAEYRHALQALVTQPQTSDQSRY